jgi:thioredoxin 1
MNKKVKLIIVVALLAAIGVVLAVKQNKSSPETKKEETSQQQPVQGSASLPRLVDLGAKKCIPCKMMAPILEELKKEFAGVLNVDFIDVWQSPEKAKEYSLQVIPTQIFYDASSKELYRHEGFFSKEDILAKWKDLGVKLTKTK